MSKRFFVREHACFAADPYSILLITGMNDDLSHIESEFNHEATVRKNPVSGLIDIWADSKHMIDRVKLRLATYDSEPSSFHSEADRHAQRIARIKDDSHTANAIQELEPIDYKMPFHEEIKKLEHELRDITEHKRQAVNAILFPAKKRRAIAL